MIILKINISTNLKLTNGLSSYYLLLYTFSQTKTSRIRKKSKWWLFRKQNRRGFFYICTMIHFIFCDIWSTNLIFSYHSPPIPSSVSLSTPSLHKPFRNWHFFSPLLGISSVLLLLLHLPLCRVLIFLREETGSMNTLYGSIFSGAFIYHFLGVCCLSI